LLGCASLTPRNASTPPRTSSPITGSQPDAWQAKSPAHGFWSAPTASFGSEAKEERVNGESSFPWAKTGAVAKTANDTIPISLAIVRINLPLNDWLSVKSPKTNNIHLDRYRPDLPVFHHKPCKLPAPLLNLSDQKNFTGIIHGGA
jgi:hypothetical protein